VPEVSKETASQIAVEYVKRQKASENIDVAEVEAHSGGYFIRGTCQISLEGHQWAEKFEVFVDPKGKIKSAYFSLL
jgi:hypothetical protein